MSYSLDKLLKEDLSNKGKIAQFERQQPPVTTDPKAYAAYNAALGDLEERIVKLREKPSGDRDLFSDLDFLLGG